MKKKNKNKWRKPDEFILSTLRWFANSLKLNYQDTTIALQVASKIFTILDTRGKTQCIKYVKDLRLKFTKIMLSIDPVNFKCQEKLWLPKFFIPIIRRIEESRSYPLIRLILTSLYITRFIRLEGEVSLDSITKGPGYSGNLYEIESEVPHFLKEIGVNLNHLGQIPKSLRFKEFHMTSKSGPNGHALWSSFLDGMTLSKTQRESIKTISGDKLSELIDKFSSLYKRVPQFFDSRHSRKGVPLTRKIVKILDKEGKIREVAIGDYYTQVALQPLHNYLTKILSNINQDCTSDQIKLFYSIEKSIGNNYHSIDLKSFTDRLPIDLNYTLLKVWFGEEFAKAWKYLMVGEPFDYKGHKVTYATGNPMGLYSSFNSSALVHHFLVWKACKMSNLRWKRSRYMLLGDDIVIANDTLASNYKKLLIEWDVEIQHSKTHTSPNGFEFAKQIRLHGLNVSPFPLSALYERRCETIASCSIIIQEFAYKRWESDLISSLEKYYLNVLLWSKKKFLNYKPTLELVISFLKVLQGNGSLGNAISAYVKSSFPGAKRKWLKPVNRTLFAQWLTVKVVQTLYLESRERIVSKNTKGSLGDLATEMVMYITSLRDGGADCFDLIEAVPFLQVYGRAEEIYLKSYDQLYDYGMGTQPKELRTLIGKVDIPLSDDGFYTRHRDVLIVQSMRSSRIITNLLKTTTDVDAYNGQLKFTVPWADAVRKKPIVPG